jgi:hypothetical protein
MRGLFTEARPEQLPEGASPLSVNTDYVVGSVGPRPGKTSAYTYGDFSLEFLCGFAKNFQDASNEAPWLNPLNVTLNTAGTYASVGLGPAGSGAGGGTWLDVEADAAGMSTSASATATPTAANDLAIVFGVRGNPSFSSLGSPGAGWTALAGGASNSYYQRLGAIASLTATMAVSGGAGPGGADTWAELLAIFGTTPGNPTFNTLGSGSVLGGASYPQSANLGPFANTGGAGLFIIIEGWAGNASDIFTGNPDVYSVTDTSGNVYTKVGQRMSVGNPDGTFFRMAQATLFYSPNLVASAGNTITVNLTAGPSGGTNHNVYIQQITGLGPPISFQLSQQLQCTNFPISIPNTQAILGMEIEVSGHQTSQDPTATSKLVFINAPPGTPSFTFQLPAADGTVTLGTPMTNWGFPLLAATLGNPNFGVEIQSSSPNVVCTFDIYAVKFKLFLSPTVGPNINYLKTFRQKDGDILNLFLGSDGTLYQEDAINNPTVLKGVYTAIEPNSFAQSATIDDREFIALSNLLNGTDIPYTYDGTHFDRLSQVGPGAPPTVSALQSLLTIAAAPTGLTQPPQNAGVVGTNALPGHFQSVTWASSAPSGRTPGNVLTIFYAQDAADPLAVVGNIVQLSGMANMNGQNPNGTYLITGNGFDLPGGDAGAKRYWFSVSTKTVNGVYNTGGPNTQSGNYQITLATMTTTVPVPNVSIGSQITITGVPISQWNNTWVITATLNSGQYLITQTSLTHNVATYKFTLISGVGPAVGTQVTILGCSNGPVVAGTSVFNVTNAVVTAVSPGSFSIDIEAGDVSPAAEQGSAVSNGTQFQFDPGTGLLGSATDPGYQSAIFGNSGGGSVVGIGLVAAGIRKVCYSFLTEDGYITKPSPIATVNIGTGATSLTVGALLTGPRNVIARIIHLSSANGGNFYNIPIPVIAQGIGAPVVNSSTWVRDNTSKSVVLSFSDGVLLAGQQVDTQGNNLFETAEVGSMVGLIPYASRLFAIGEQNKLTNLLNWSFDGGIAANGYPAGWSQDATNGGGGTVVGSPIFGNAYQISNATGSTQAVYGMITQGAFQDEFQVPIIQASTTYSTRLRVSIPTGPTTGQIIVELFDTGAARSLGSFSVDMSTVSANMAIFTGQVMLTGVAPVPPGLVLRVYVKNILNGVKVLFDRVEIFPTEEPVLSTDVTGSYVDNFEAFDQVTGVVGTATENQQPVKSGFVLYDTLYLVKTGSLIAVQDNGSTEPSKWKIRTVSTSVGTPSIYGVTYSGDEASSGEQWALIAGRNGLFFFDGGQPTKLMGEIESLWKLINWNYGHTIWLKNDIINRRVQVGVPLITPNKWLPTGLIPDNPNPMTPNVVINLSYKQLNTGAMLEERAGVHASAFTGKLLATEITRAWSVWTMNAPCAGFLENNVGLAPLTLGNSQANGKVYQLTEGRLDDDGSPFAEIYDTHAFVTPEQAQALRLTSTRQIYEFMRLLIDGTGDLTITVYPNTLDGPYSHALLPDLILPASTNGDTEVPVNEAGERLFLQFKCFSVGAGFTLSRVTLAMRSDPWSPVRGQNS